MRFQRLIALMALCLSLAVSALAAAPAPQDATPAAATVPPAIDEQQAPAAPEGAPAAVTPQAAPADAAATAATSSAPPTAAVAAEEKYQVYVVKKGDTLWGISRRFIEDPYYWPDLWANNPEVRNPHFIYPGQKLRIYSGPIVVMPAAPPAPPSTLATEPATPPVAAEPAPSAEPTPPAEPEILVTVPRGAGYVAAEEADSVGRVYDFTNARQMAATGDTVFIRMKPGTAAKVGDRFDVFATLEEIRHPVSKKVVGHKIVELGTLEVIATHEDVSTAILTKTYLEVTRGAWLAPRRAPRETVAMKKATNDLQGYVVSSYFDRILQGQHDVVYVDLGTKQGLAVGNLLTVTRPRTASEAVKPAKQTKETVRLPDELVGYALVVEVRATTATAVLLKALGPALVGDRVSTQTGR